MSTLLQLRDRAHRVWCVTGTPFPQGDRSVFGLHQLLGVRVNFVIAQSPFLQAHGLCKPACARARARAVRVRVLRM